MDILAPWHIVIIVAAIILLFGAKKIPEFAKSIGEGMSEFKKATGNHVEKEQKQESVKPHEPEESTSAFSNVKQHTETKNV